VSRPPGRRIISRPDGRTDGLAVPPASPPQAAPRFVRVSSRQMAGATGNRRCRPGPAWPPPDRKQDGEGAPEVDKDDDISTD